MKCIKCKKQAEIHLPNLDACTPCFEKIIEKRVRREMRIGRLIEKNDKILFLDDSSAEYSVSEFLLKRILQGLPVDISRKKTKYALGAQIEGDFNKIIIPWNTDMEGQYLLSGVFENKKLDFLGHYRIKDKLYIKPLLHVLHEEVEIFAKSQGLNFKATVKKSDILDELKKEYPEIKFSLLKSAQEILKLR